MKIRLLERVGRLGFGSAAVIVALLAFGATGAEPNERELKERAAGLEKRARALEAEGETERARELRRELEALRERAGQPRAEARERERDQPLAAERMRQLKRAQAGVENQRAARKGEPRPRPGFEPRYGREGFEAMAPERRLRHLKAAIQNLHAAGLHEPADRLAEQARMMEAELPSRGRRDFGPGRPPEEEMRQLRAEVQELRRAVRDLRARLEEPRGERR